MDLKNKIENMIQSGQLRYEFDRITDEISITRGGFFEPKELFKKAKNLNEEK